MKENNLICSVCKEQTASIIVADNLIKYILFCKVCYDKRNVYVRGV